MNHTYRFYDDPGHAWLEVPRGHLDQLGIANQISTYSYQHGLMVYLEEDRDAGVFMDAARAAGMDVTFKVIHQVPTPIRDYNHYTQ